MTSARGGVVIGGRTVADRTARGAPGVLAGWRWKATLTLLAFATVIDLLLVISLSERWSVLQLPLMLLVSAVAVAGLRRGGTRLFSAARLAAPLSLVVTAGLSTCAAVVDTSFDFGFVEGTTLTLVLVACWRRAGGRRQQVVAGAVALAVVVLPLRTGWTYDTPLITVLAVAVVALAVATGSVLRAADTSHDATVTAVRRAEREEVARELHDVVAHHVTGMVVLTQAARTVASSPAGVLVPAGGAVPPSGSAPGLDDALAAVERAGAEALSSLRSMVTVLRSPDAEGPGGTPLEPTPTVEDLGDVVRRFRASGAAGRVDLEIAPEARALAPQVQAALHRVVQESLTNASRYARGAQSVSIDLAAAAAGRTVLVVSDSGGRAEEVADGGGSTWGGGFGIVGMRERVEALGGTLTAGPTQGTAGSESRGWTVRAEVPG